jgi:vesicle-fusing ATPase
MKDFLLALEEVKPSFGVDDKSLENSFRGGIYNHGSSFAHVYSLCQDFVQSVKKSSSANPLLSILLEGDNGSGKTALAAKIAVDSGFPFVKMISPEHYVGYTDFAKVQAINKVFEDAYKSPLSLIVLDDIERLLEFVHIGPRFSNLVL